MSKPDPRLVFYVVLGLGALYLVSKATGAAGKLADSVGNVITHDLNPASSDNLINRGVEGIGSFLTGDDSWTLGGSIYDWTHRPTSVERISSIEEITYDEMGNVIGTGISSSEPTFTNDQLTRIGGPGLFGVPGYGEQAPPTFAGTIGGIVF